MATLAHLLPGGPYFSQLKTPSVVNQIYQPKTDSGVPRLPCIARASVKSAVRTHQSRSCPHNPRLVHPWWPGTPGPSPRPWVSAWRQFYFVSRSAAGLTACTRLSGVPVGCNRRVIGAARAVRRCPSRPRESVADGPSGASCGHMPPRPFRCRAAGSSMCTRSSAPCCAVAPRLGCVDDRAAAMSTSSHGELCSVMRCHFMCQ